MVTKKKRSNSLFLCHNGYGDNMLEEYGKVMKVFIPKQYKNDILLDVMNRTNVGFEILVNGKIKEYIVEANNKNVSFFLDAYSSEILVYSVGKSLDNDFIEYNLNLLNNSNYKLENVMLHSDRDGMYKSGIYNTKTAEMNIIPSMSAPCTYTYNPWIETLNVQFKDFIKNHYPKNLDELQIVLKQFVYYNNNIKIKNKLKTTPINYRCSHV